MRAALATLLLCLLAPAAALADGAPDRSFGHAGSTSFAVQGFAGGAGVAVDAQGRVIVAATLDDGSHLRNRAAVWRLLPDGSLDPAFGTAGMATVVPPPAYQSSSAAALAVDAKGRIVVAGAVEDDIPAVWRLLPDGSPDPAFAGNGASVARGTFGDLPGTWQAVALDGPSIVVAGAVYSEPPNGTRLGHIGIVARFGDDGVPDATFAGTGFLELPLAGVTGVSGRHPIAIDASGRIVLSIYHAASAPMAGVPGSPGFAELVRLDGTGTLDPTFGQAGEVVLGHAGLQSPSVGLTRAGAIVAFGGWAPLSDRGTIAAARYLPSGAIDTTFATQGRLTGTPSQQPSDGALDCQGDLLLLSGSDHVARYGPDGRLDPTFRSTPVPPVAVEGMTVAPALGSVALTAGGAIVLAGGATFGPPSVGAGPLPHYALAAARITASCPITDSTRPTVTLACNAGCRRVVGVALDDPVGRGVRRVLLGIQRTAGTRCEAWNGRRFSKIACRKAATRLVAVAVAPGGAFRSPPLGRGRYVVRAVVVDGAGNRSAVAVRRATR